MGAVTSTYVSGGPHSVWPVTHCLSPGGQGAPPPQGEGVRKPSSFLDACVSSLH